MRIDHPFFVKLHFTFQDDDRLCIFWSFKQNLRLRQVTSVPVIVSRNLSNKSSDHMCYLLFLSVQCTAHLVELQRTGKMSLYGYI